MENDKIYCPCCERELIITHQERYQDICEHVSQPNATPSLKDVYECPYEYCEANQLNADWIKGGEVYMSPPEGIKWTTAHRILEKCSVSGMSYALNSWQHHYNLGKKAIKAKKFSIPFFKYKFDFEPKDKGHKYPTSEQYQPARFSWKTTIWKKSEHGHTNVVPFWRMSKYTIRQFKNAYSRWILDPKNARLFNEAREYGLGISKWDNNETLDSRFYYKVSRLWLRLFHPRKMRKINTTSIPR